ncbi:MAG TPA: hypothetical protein VFA74_11685 [Terriglobales bacterium]|nr:hypothetical protein [Terriglobales bacterium]
MKIHAILTLTGSSQPEDALPASDHPDHPYGTWEILGKSLVERTLEHLKLAGISNSSTISENGSHSYLFPSRAASTSNFVSTWEHTISKHLNEGAEFLLLIRIGPYVELDFENLLLFHRETAGTLTQVYDQSGALDIALVSATALRNGTGTFRNRLSAAVPKHRRYMFSGYASRLKQLGDFRRLTQDALLGRNGIKPFGRQVSPGIWVAPDCRVDSSVNVVGPLYIGARSRIGAFCKINNATAIERDCEVDCGTYVENSSILAETSLGMGLQITNSIVLPGKLFRIDRNIEIDIKDRALIGRTFRFNALTNRFNALTNKRKTILPGRWLWRKKNSQPTAHVSASIHC